MPAAGALFALLFVLAIAGTIGLWYVIESETDDAPRMDRRDAERAVRKDTDDDTDGSDGNGSDDDHVDEWGSDAEWGVDENRRFSSANQNAKRSGDDDADDRR